MLQEVRVVRVQLNLQKEAHVCLLRLRGVRGLGQALELLPAFLCETADAGEVASRALALVAAVLACEEAEASLERAAAE